MAFSNNHLSQSNNISSQIDGIMPLEFFNINKNDKLFGVGVDIIEIDRFKKSIHNEKFLAKVYTEDEIKFLSEKPLESYAGLFSCKEAVAKALGVGFSSFLPCDIEVLRDKEGKPFVKLGERVYTSYRQLKNVAIEVSISHNNTMAIAFAVAINKD